ncbi:ATP-grasp domain-containing protein [Streptomyces sp. t39]|uniref:carboxylate--amine ligase n=1 Tax=Streptomyces sp. t39 TaxID=1828156 RepID=UPI0011CEAF92|nr:ATP-grasp domain-containing protein [Streptomyces sp. t39]TXS57860.1 ATP-grasp domain-containing protein [Streptomyces sp. t39]
MTDLDPAVPALVLRLDRNPFHHGTLGAVRSLGRAGVEVHAVVESARSPVARSRHLHRAHPRPPGAPEPDALVRTLLAVADRIGRPAVLVPMDDLGAIRVAEHADALAGRYLLPAQPPGLPGRLADKAELAKVCAEAGIPHPDTFVPASAAEAADTVRRIGVPLVAKWSRPWLLDPATGLRSTSLVASPAAAARLYERRTAAGSTLLLQRYLPERPHSDWFFHGCFGAGAVCLHGGTGRKELSWPPRTGLTALGRWKAEETVTTAALRLARHTGYQGILDLDFRRDTGGGCLLLDANPRPGAQFRLFTGEDGLDVVRALHLDLTGRPVPPSAGRPGRVFVAENYALLSAFASARPGRGVRLRARRGVETAWFARDDPAPFAAMAGAWLGRGLAKGARRLRPRAAPPPVHGTRPTPDPDTRNESAPCTTWQ